MDTSKLERMGRRRFMENLAGIGGTALIAGIMFEDVSAGAKSTTAQRVEDELGGSFLGSI